MAKVSLQQINSGSLTNLLAILIIILAICLIDCAIPIYSGALPARLNRSKSSAFRNPNLPGDFGVRHSHSRSVFLPKGRRKLVAFAAGLFSAESHEAQISNYMPAYPGARIGH